MEARGRRISGSLPGYNGPALPRAMRSARGRGETGSRQSSELGGRSGFFELLATVAGQFLQDASTGQEKDGEKLKQNCSQFAGSVVVTSQGISETAQSGFPPRFESGFALSGSGGTGNLLPCKQNKVPRCKASPSNANSFQGTVGFDKDTASTSIEDQKHAGAASPLSNVSTEDMSPQTLDPLGAGLATSQRIEGACCRIKDTTINSDISAVSVDCHLCTSTNRHANDCTGGHLVVRDVCDYYVRDEKLEPCKPCGPCHKQTKNGTTVRCICKLLSEEIHSCDVTIAEQKSTQDSSKGLRGPRYDSCEDAANIKEEILEHVISESTPVQKSLAVENGHRDVSGDVCMVDRTGMEDYEASNRCVCKAEEKRTGSTCERQQEKFVVDTGNCLSVNVSSIEEVVGSEEAEQVGTQSHFIVQKDHHGCELSERKGKWVLRRKSTDLSKGASAKDSYVKGLKVRKLSKAAKRNQGSVSCTKRKHAEIEPQADTDLFQCKKGYFGNVAFTRRRTSRSFSAKRNKIGDGPLDLVPNLELSAKNLTADCADGEPPAAAAKLRSAKTASVASSPAAGPSKLASKKSLEAHVKLSIKSFTVPELFVDLPESATVANLKRAVMDAAMNLLGGGLRVRVLLQGKKIPDEGVSLGQMGISRHGNPESLGFMLEPSPLPSSPTAAEDPLLVLSRAAAQPSPRYPVFSVPGLPVAGEGGRSPSKNRAGKGSSMLETEDSFEAMACEQHMLSDPNGNGLSFSLGTDDSLKACNAKAKSVSGERMTLSSHSTRVAAAGALAAIRAQADASRRAKNEADSAAVSATNDSLVSGTGAIILHPSVGADNMQGVALVPVRPKLRAIDTNKRRIRRPFSVAEVEALVHAVEKLGTGRWRDVKLRAFDQAKHRTYVDLKDKWKTLVHTARIAPHQRRGEPVPQELLERVTRAHTYWAAQQAKQQAELEF